MVDIGSQLSEHLNDGSDWDKMEAPIPGVFIVRVPATKTRGPLLNIEVNPLNEHGKPMKRKGLFISSKVMLGKFTDALNNDKLNQLMTELEKVNPSTNGNGKLKKLQM